MELKDPKPLGESKTTESTLTTQFLEIAKEKDQKKIKLPKIIFPTFDFLKSQKHTSEHNHSNKEKIEEKKPEKKYTSISTFWYLVFLPYLKEHKSQVVNISLIAFPLLLLTILLISIFTYTRAEPYRISKEFLQKIEERDVAGAYELTTDAYHAVVLEKEFKEIVNRLNTVDISNAKIKKKHIDDRNEMGRYAYIKYKVSGYYLDIVMFNDSDDWGVHSIEISVIQ